MTRTPPDPGDIATRYQQLATQLDALATQLADQIARADSNGHTTTQKENR